MKENKFTELVTFLVANVVSTEVKSINDGIVIIFIDAEKDIEICKNVMLGVNDINHELEVVNLDDYDEATLLILRDILITARQNIFLNNKCHKVKDYINGRY